MNIEIKNLTVDRFKNKTVQMGSETYKIAPSKEATPEETEIFNNLKNGQFVDVKEWTSPKGFKYLFLTTPKDKNPVASLKTASNSNLNDMLQVLESKFVDKVYFDSGIQKLLDKLDGLSLSPEDKIKKELNLPF